MQQGPAWKILAKQHYCLHRVEDLAQSNSAKWWKQIIQLTGQVSDKSSEWFHRFIGPDQFHDCLALANGINDFFLSHSFRLWSIPQLIILSFHLFFSIWKRSTERSHHLSLNKAAGPAAFLTRFLKNLHGWPEHAPILCDIYSIIAGLICTRPA